MISFLRIYVKILAFLTFFFQFCLGFVTGSFANPPRYTYEQANEMIQTLNKNQILAEGTKKITFPIRALYAGMKYLTSRKFFPQSENYKFAADSQNVIQYLLDSTSTPTLNSTLTIWGSDIISNNQLLALKNFISQIGKNRVYVDTAYDLNSDTYKPLLLTIFENIF